MASRDARRRFAPVPVLDCSNVAKAKLQYRSAIANGKPVVLEGGQILCLVDFAKPWFDNARQEFSVKQFMHSVGEEMAPIARNGYTGNQLGSGEQMQIRQYMSQYWPLSHARERYPYLAQWEFASAVLDLDSSSSGTSGDASGSEEENARGGGGGGLSLPHWRHSRVPVDVIGTDFLSVGGSTTTTAAGGGGRLNPFQYLFIGGPGTNSKLHNDTGGMTILISCLVGRKRFTLIHRDEEFLLNQMRDMHMTNKEIINHAQSRIMRAWECVIEPGQVLAIPPRTYHAVENLTEVMSYSRFHVTCEDLAEWLRSFIVFDSPMLPHEQTIREAVQWFLLQERSTYSVDDDDDGDDDDDDDNEVEERVRCLKHLRDACRVLASRVEGYDETKFWIWITFAEQLDSRLPERQQRPAFTSQNTPKDENDGTPMVGDLVALLPGVARGERRDRRAVVLQVDMHAVLCKVYFPKFSYAELIPMGLLRAAAARGRSGGGGGAASSTAAAGSSSSSSKLAYKSAVEVQWSTGEVFQGVVESQLPIPSGIGLLIQFHGLGSEWNQWVSMKDVARVTRGFHVEL